QDKINAALLLKPSSSAVLQRAASDWTDTHLNDAGGEDCTDMTIPQGHIQALQSATCTVSPTFDLTNLLNLVCAVVGSVDVDSNGNPDVFSGDATVTVSTLTACGITDITTDQTLPLEVEEVSGSDDYSRKL